jgi:allantoin racemase
MSAHIRVIFPGRKADFHTQEHLKDFKSCDFKVDIVHAQVGPETIASRYEEALAIPGTLQQICRAEKEGVDAVVIDCMGDPGVEQGRELVRIPVIGPSRISMHVASTLGERFAVITMAEAVNPLVRQQARLFNLESRLAAVISIEIPPADLQCDISRTTKAICEAALQAVQFHSADTVIFGCCGMMGCAEDVKQFLLNENYNIQIVDPLPLAIHYANMLVKLKLSHSKRLYGQHDLSIFPGYEFLGT